MAAPSYRAAALGGTDAGGAWSYQPGGWSTVGEVVVCQILQDGATNGAVTFTGSSGINKLDGTAGWTAIPGPNADGSFPVGASGEARQFLFIGRSFETAPAISGGNSTSEDLYCIYYGFSSVSSGTTLATVIENGTGGSTANGVGTSNTAADTGVTTLGPDRLALNLLAINDDNSFAGFTGESGGTWSLPGGASYAESSGTDGALWLSVATISSAGTIDGGTGSITDSDAWGVVGFALIGTTVPVPPVEALVHTHPAYAVMRAANW